MTEFKENMNTLKCGIDIAGNDKCIDKIKDKKCPFIARGQVINQRCALVCKKVTLA